MIKNKELGVKIAKDSDEAFWTDTKEKLEDSNKSEARNDKIRSAMLELCSKELADK